VPGVPDHRDRVGRHPLGELIVVETILAGCFLAAFVLFAYYCGGCPNCRGHRQARRWYEDDGIHIECAGCHEVSVIVWEDLH